MAGPYNPPNPYGSYFSFGQPEGAVGQTFGPMPYGTNIVTLGIDVFGED